MRIETFSHPYHSYSSRGYPNSSSGRIVPAIIWIFFLCGVIFQQFTTLIPLLASLVPCILTLTSSLVVYSFLRRSNSIPLALSWVITVFCAGFFAEVLGTHTGLLFGDYFYGEVLGPKVWGVPLLIGCAWVKVLILSYFLVTPRVGNPLLAALVCAAFTTCYDIVMEPAATQLSYWTWLSVTIPLWNYVCWFILSFILALPATALQIAHPPFPTYVLHLFFAEQVYFLLITIAPLVLPFIINVF